MDLWGTGGICGAGGAPVTPPPLVPPQVVLLSATMPMDVLEVTKKFMRDPIRILVKKEELTLEGIRQFYINVEREVGPPRIHRPPPKPGEPPQNEGSPPR